MCAILSLTCLLGNIKIISVYMMTFKLSVYSMGIMTALAYCYELTISKFKVYHFIMDVMITDANGTF